MFGAWKTEKREVVSGFWCPSAKRAVHCGRSSSGGHLIFARIARTAQLARINATATAYTPREELANVLTHAFGLALSVAGLVVLLFATVAHGGALQVSSAAIFGASLVLLYATSTLYHGMRGAERKYLLRKFDHAAIFLLIAGTYTPFLLVSLRGPWGWSLFGVIWALAVMGIALKFWFAGRFKVVSTLIYLAMGWMIILAAKPMLLAVAPHGLWLLFAGGLCYTLGSVFYLWRRLPYHHAIWHLFVLAGSLCHWASIYGYVLTRTPV